MKIMTLMDNLPGAQKSLQAEHGLSFFVETEHVKILFDFGSGIHTLENAAKLNVKLSQIDYSAGSHGHYDHAGGYPFFAEAGLTCPLVTGRGYFEEKYALSGRKAAFLGAGFDESFLAGKHIPHIQCRDILPLAEGCWALGGFKRTREFEAVPERFVIRREEKWVPDLFEDEICLALEEKGGLTVILGCSHPGILNILDRVKEQFSLPIRAVVGGTHMAGADRRRIEKTIQAMKEMGIWLLGFNHCSGALLREMLDGDPSLDTVYLGAGDCLFL